jgi:GDP-fucose protein O-fucosyltransferase
MSRLFFKLYHAGLNNCRMSLDIGIGLAHLTGRILAPYGVKPAWCSDPVLHEGVDYERSTNVLDLFDLPIPLKLTHAEVSEIEFSGVRRLLSAPVNESVLHNDSAASLESDDFFAFRNGRTHVQTLGEALDDDQDLIVDGTTLGMYSQFFYADAAIRSDLRRLFGGVRPRQPYRDLAHRISESLAPYNAVHIRRGDFLYAGLSPRGHCVNAEEVASNLASRLSTEQRLLVCTDGFSEEIWFAPLRRTFRDVVFLDHLLLDSWRSGLQALPYRDDVVLGLITQLVAALAECFVGTLYSSFTALIQRSRGFCGRPDFLYCYSDWDPKLVPFERCEFPPVQAGPYSWNRILYPVDPSVSAWFRDWPEAYQEASAGAGYTAAPGTVLLRASEARLAGPGRNYEQFVGYESTGLWTNLDDYLIWSFSLEAEIVCRLEIRYACADDCAGSSYTIELETGTQIVERVAATGGWGMFSSWQTLATLKVPSGRHTLCVQVAAMPGSAAMNLAGLRLVPTVESSLAVESSARCLR